MTIIEKLKQEIEIYDGRNWKKILDDFSNLNQDELSEIAISDIEQLTHRDRIREHRLNVKLDLWNEFSMEYKYNILEYIFNSLGYYVNLILYFNSPRRWCEWVSKFCDYVMVSFIQCILRQSISHVDFSALLEMSSNLKNNSLTHFLIYSYICDDVFINNPQVLHQSKFMKDQISVIVPVLSDISHPFEIEKIDNLCEAIISVLGEKMIISNVCEIIKSKIHTNELKGEFRLWAKCLSMTSCVLPDQEFSELYCQWLENLLHDVNLTYDFITSESKLHNLERLNTILIVHCLNDQAIDHIKSIFVKSFSPYGGWNDPNKAWKRDYLFQHTGLLLCTFGIRDSANDELINFILVHVYKIIPFVLNESEYNLLLACIISYPWNEEHKSLTTLIRIVNAIDSLELIEHLENQYLKSGGKSSLLLDALSTQKNLLQLFNQQ